MGSLAMFPVIYSTMGTIAGITHRVGQLLQALEELEVPCCELGRSGDARLSVCSTRAWAALPSLPPFPAPPPRPI